MRKRTLILLVIFSYLFPVIGNLQAKVSTKTEINYSKRVLEFIDYGLSINEKILGSILREEVKNEKNEYIAPEETMRVTKRHYDGAVVIFYDGSSTPNEVDVFSSHVPLPYGIRIGNNINAVVSKLGVASSDKNNTLTYQNSAEKVELKFENGKLSNVHWFVIGY